MSNVFTDAIKVIGERGWATSQNDYLNKPGEPVCILGAVAEAKGMTAEDWCELVDRREEALENFVLRKIIQEQYPEFRGRGPVTAMAWTWNDDVATKPEVIAILEKAAARVEDE